MYPKKQSDNTPWDEQGRLKNLLESTSFRRFCFIGVSSFVRVGSTQIVLKLTQVELWRGTVQNTHAKSMWRCPLSSPLAMILPLLLFLSDPTSAPRLLKHTHSAPLVRLWGTRGQQEYCSCILYWVLYWNSQNPRGRSKQANFPYHLTTFSLAKPPPLDFPFSAGTFLLPGPSRLARRAQLCNLHVNTKPMK